MPNNKTLPPLTVEFITSLYSKYAASLSEVRVAQQAFCKQYQGQMVPQLDDLEAEITYLLLREYRPRSVLELGTYHGWSTTWILSALRDNGTGHLYSIDLIDNVVRNIPAELAKDRWTFSRADIRTSVNTLPKSIDYLFIDAAHSGGFARWYISHIFPSIVSGTPISIHDVFHGRYAMPLTEGAVVLRWLKQTQTAYFTASAARAPQIFHQLSGVKKELGLDMPIRKGKDNPMIFFRMPENGV